MSESTDDEINDFVGYIDEENIMPHPQLRLYPPPIYDRDEDGDIVIGFRMTDEEFLKLSNFLTTNGYAIDDSGGYEVFVQPYNEDGTYKESYRKR